MLWDTNQHNPAHKERGLSIMGQQSGGTRQVEPIFVTVKEAARILALSPFTVSKKLDAGAIDSRYEGKRRLVRLSSLQEYADSLPTTRPSGPTVRELFEGRES
jgi:excisionase family DNA binding protein